MNIKNQFTVIYLQKIKKLVLPRDLIRYAVKKHYGKTAVIDGEREISYGGLYERAKKLSNALLKIGMDKGDKLGVLLYNSQEYFEIRIATYLTGIVLVPIVWDMELDNIIFILNDCQVKTLIYHPEILQENIETVKERTQVQNFISLPYEDFISKATAAEPNVKLKRTDLASINFSSGTTGRPKGIVLLEKSWMSSFYNYILNSPRARVGKRVILHILSFATAGSTAFLPSFFLGAKNIILNRFDVEKAISAILRYKVNSIFVSPSLFICMLDYCKSKIFKLPSLNAIVIGTEAMPQEKFKEAIEFFGPIIQRGYGMAEVLPPLCLLCSRDYIHNGKLNADRLLSAGRALTGVRIKVIDKEGRQLPSSKIGRIVLKSATLSQGYWHNPQLSQRHYKDDFFYSDDFGYIDEQGYLYILGRKEDIIKEDKEGIIFACEIEEVLHKHPKVLETYVFESSAKIVACVSLKGDSKDVTSEKLIKFCQERLEKDKVPHVVTILPELPKNASGKLDRIRIRMDLLKVYNI